MKFIAKLNPAVKMFILVVYALVLVAIAIFIINIQGLDETEGYSSKGIDENIQIVSKLMESRTAASLTTANARERANWTISLQVAKHNANVEVSKIETYVKAKTEKGTTIYFEESAKKSTSYKGTPSTSSSAFSSYSTGIAKSATYSSSTKEYTKSNTELKMVYIRTTYVVTAEDGTETQKELKYYFVPVKPEQEDFSKYSKTIALTENKVESSVLLEEDEKSIFTLKIKPTMNEEKTTAEKTYSDRVETSVSMNLQSLKDDELYVVNSSATVFAKVKNDKTDTDNFFADYITVMDVHGAMVDNNNISAWTTYQVTSLSKYYNSSCSINTSYEVSTLYIVLSATFNDGTTEFVRVKVTLPKA